MDTAKTVEVVTIHTDGVPIVLRFPEADLPQPYRSAPELLEALKFYADPGIYKPHPHGAAFDRRDLSHIARAAIAAATEG